MAAVHALFAAKTRNAKLKLSHDIEMMLEDEVAQGEPGNDDNHVYPVS